MALKSGASKLWGWWMSSKPIGSMAPTGSTALITVPATMTDRMTEALRYLLLFAASYYAPFATPDRIAFLITVIRIAWTSYGTASQLWYVAGILSAWARRARTYMATKKVKERERPEQPISPTDPRIVEAQRNWVLTAASTVDLTRTIVPVGKR